MAVPLSFQGRAMCCGSTGEKEMNVSEEVTFGLGSTG